jgi:flagellar biosynthesis/type III secretory pathway M-ring protein FliF/YscJ
VETPAPIDTDPVDEEQLRATLAELVRQNPDQAAQMLNQWMARAG